MKYCVLLLARYLFLIPFSKPCSAVARMFTQIATNLSLQSSIGAGYILHFISVVQITLHRLADYGFFSSEFYYFSTML